MVVYCSTLHSGWLGGAVGWFCGKLMTYEFDLVRLRVRARVSDRIHWSHQCKVG